MTNLIELHKVSVVYRSNLTRVDSIRDIIISKFIKNKKHLNKYHGDVVALNNINFSIQEGQRIGLIGVNGSGKSTFLKVISGVIPPTSGKVNALGSVNAIFDPSLGMDPEATGYENIHIRCMLMGLSENKINDVIEPIAEFSGIGIALGRPLKTYSTGMAMRLAFSIATVIEPEILVMDEWLSAGDARFVSKALQRMESLVRASRALILASHSEHILREWCNHLLWFENGKIIDEGPPDKILDLYHKHS
jgi:lipopolysaccharide transport system ATP-binding protein